MRRFSSYGPVDPRFHFTVARSELVERCVDQLVCEPGEGGHYFTIWGARQTGKTWLMRRAMEEIRARHGDRFTVGALSMQALLADNDTEEVFFRSVPRMFRDGFLLNLAEPTSWEGWRDIFDKEGAAFQRPRWSPRCSR